MRSIKYISLILIFILGTYTSLLTFAQQYQGKIGSRLVIIEPFILKEDNRTIEGKYIDKQTKKQYILRGVISSKRNQVILNEYDENNKNTGRFIGILNKKKQVIGLIKWQDIKKKKTLKVNVSPIKIIASIPSVPAYVQKLYTIPEGYVINEAELSESLNNFYAVLSKIPSIGSYETKQFIVVNGKKEKEYDLIVPTLNEKKQLKHLHFSSDEKHFVYVAKKNEKSFVIFDGIESNPYDVIVFGPIFSPDGKSFGYIARKSDKFIVIIDNKEVDQNSSISGLRFSLNGRYGYIKGSSIVVDGKKLDSYQQIIDITFSPDGKDFVYSAINKDLENILVFNGEIREKHKNKMIGNLTFSPDGKRFGYIVWDNDLKKSYVVIDGIEGEKFDLISPIEELIFSPDSKHIAYVIEEGAYSRVVKDGEKSEDYDMIKYITFSPDSKHFAYVGMKGIKNVVVVDGKKVGEYFEVKNFIFSHDSKHFAYLATEITDITSDSFKPSIILDGKKIKLQVDYDKIFDIKFSRDSKYLIVLIQKGNELLKISEKIEK